MLHVRALLLSAFEQDFEASLFWVKWAEEQDDLSDDFLTQFSALINSHHIHLARLKQLDADSDWNDVFRISFMERLLQDNLQQTNAYLEFDMDSNSNDNLHAPQVLLHILLENAAYRGKLELMTGVKSTAFL